MVKFIDTTEKRDTLEALSASAERFRSLLEYAPFTVVLQDLDARIQLVNSAYEDFCISGADQLVGSVAPERFGPELAAPLAAVDHDVMATGRVVGMEADVTAQNLPAKFLRITKFPASAVLSSTYQHRNGPRSVYCKPTRWRPSTS